MCVYIYIYTHTEGKGFHDVFADVPPKPPRAANPLPTFREREFFIHNLLVRIPFIIVMIRWTGLASWEFEFPFSR